MSQLLDLCLMILFLCMLSCIDRYQLSKHQFLLLGEILEEFSRPRRRPSRLYAIANPNSLFFTHRRRCLEQ